MSPGSAGEAQSDCDPSVLTPAPCSGSSAGSTSRDVDAPSSDLRVVDAHSSDLRVVDAHSSDLRVVDAHSSDLRVVDAPVQGGTPVSGLFSASADGSTLSPAATGRAAYPIGLQ